MVIIKGRRMAKAQKAKHPRKEIKVVGLEKMKADVNGEIRISAPLAHALTDLSHVHSAIDKSDSPPVEKVMEKRKASNLLMKDPQIFHELKATMALINTGENKASDGRDGFLHSLDSNHIALPSTIRTLSLIK